MLSFKGGTSLAKAYALIDRFSEDIDVILDWRLLGYGINEPWKDRSNTQQDKFNAEAEDRAATFLRDEFVPKVEDDLCRILGRNVSIDVAAEAPQTVEFSYPRSFSARSVLQIIRLEFGALAAWTPAEDKEIVSFVAEEYPKIFHAPGTLIRTVTAERTFWEKATILHREANRQKGSFPSRYSRHYYDLYRMAITPVKDNALHDVALLKTVVDFKKKFYRCAWARYDEAVRGNMKLMPPGKYLEELKKDYEHMESMIFSPAPKFDDVMEGIATLEKEINTLA